MNKKFFIITITVIFASGLSAVFFNRLEIKEWWQNFTEKPLPKPIAIENINYELPIKLESNESSKNAGEKPDDKKEETIIKSPRLEENKLPNEINLAVPFTVQAPFADWNLPYKETCEEASILMAEAFYNKKYLTPNLADAEILNLVNFQKKYFGFYEDTDAAQTAEIARKYYDFKNIKIIYDITIEDIKKELALGYPVIIPAAGRLLPNPYFRQPGPLYHMLVIKGYTADGRFITNDPGTKRGADFLYRYEDLYSAIHDWNNGDVYKGKKTMIVIMPRSDN